jgi:hypothetical protein
VHASSNDSLFIINPKAIITSASIRKPQHLTAPQPSQDIVKFDRFSFRHNSYAPARSNASFFRPLGTNQKVLRTILQFATLKLHRLKSPLLLLQFKFSFRSKIHNPPSSSSIRHVECGSVLLRSGNNNNSKSKSNPNGTQEITRTAAVVEESPQHKTHHHGVPPRISPPVHAQEVVEDCHPGRLGRWEDLDGQIHGTVQGDDRGRLFVEGQRDRDGRLRPAAPGDAPDLGHGRPGAVPEPGGGLLPGGRRLPPRVRHHRPALPRQPRPLEEGIPRPGGGGHPRPGGRLDAVPLRRPGEQDGQGESKFEFSRFER